MSICWRATCYVHGILASFFSRHTNTHTSWTSCLESHFLICLPTLFNTLVKDIRMREPERRRRWIVHHIYLIWCNIAESKDNVCSKRFIFSQCFRVRLFSFFRFASLEFVVRMLSVDVATEGLEWILEKQQPFYWYYVEQGSLQHVLLLFGCGRVCGDWKLPGKRASYFFCRLGYAVHWESVGGEYDKKKETIK